MGSSNMSKAPATQYTDAEVRAAYADLLGAGGLEGYYRGYDGAYGGHPYHADTAGHQASYLATAGYGGYGGYGGYRNYGGYGHPGSAYGYGYPGYGGYAGYGYAGAHAGYGGRYGAYA